MPATTITESHPFDSHFSYSVDGGDNYVQLADVVSLTPPNMSRGTGDRTRLSASKMIKRFVRGWVDSGEYKVRIQYKGSVYTTLLALFLKTAHETHETYRHDFPLLDGEATPASLEFDGFMTAFPLSEGSVDNDDVYECDITIKIDGEAIFTEAE